MHSIRDLFGNAGLTRARDGRLLGGVVSGLGRRIGLGPWTARLLFVLALLLVGGTQIWIYPMLWILMPLAPAAGWAPASQPSGAEPHIAC